MAKYDRHIPGSPDEAPYKQSRHSLRERFGPRAIDASAPPSARNMSSTAAGMGTFGGGLTPAHNWKSFFRPVTPETSMFSQATMGATGAPPLTAQAPVAPMIEGVPAQGELPQAAAAPTMASVPAPALPAPPVDYLKAAHERSMQFFNAQGQSIATPAAGAVQAGTSFRSRFGTGSVVSAESQNRLQRMMRRASAGLPRMFDDV